MKITTTGRQMNVREDLETLTAKKLAKFDRFFGDEAEAFVSFSRRHNLEMVEITISYNGTYFRSEEGNTTFNNALDCAVDSLERQMRKNKTRLEKRLRDGAFDDGCGDRDDVEEESEYNIRTKVFDLKPMSVEEAIMQMNLLEHEFFVFVDSDTEKTCVVYKRRDGAYGIIVPER